MAGPAIEGAPDNCEEYFLIAQTAVKIGLAIKFPHQADAIFRCALFFFFFLAAASLARGQHSRD